MLLPKPAFYVASVGNLFTTTLCFVTRPLAVVEPGLLDRWICVRGAAEFPPSSVVRSGSYTVRVDHSLGSLTALHYLGSPPVVRSADWQSLPAFNWYR